VDHLEFLRDRFGGKNWVLARRTPRIVERYGQDVICVSKKCYDAVEKEYRRIYGDPHDKVRARLYCALSDALAAMQNNDWDSGLLIQMADALEAERNAR